MGITMPIVDPQAQEILMNYKWPGNVRELRNVVQRLVLNNTGHIGVKEVSDPMVLKNSILSKDTSFDELNTGQVLTLREMEKAFRLRYFKYVRSISSSDTNAAEKLGITPSNFYRICKELGSKIKLCLFVPANILGCIDLNSVDGTGYERKSQLISESAFLIVDLTSAILILKFYRAPNERCCC